MALENSQPFISICIPVKNGEGRLEHCLESVRRLDYPQDKIEVIIADGMSTDRTAEIAKSFGATVLENSHQIVASGRNVAFKAARGQFIASTDDDCVLPAQWLSIALKAFDDPMVAAVGGPSFLPKQSPALAKAANYIFRQASHVGYSVQADHFVAGDADDLPGGNTLYRTDILRKVGAFDEGLITAEDVELHMRIRDLGKKLVVSPDFYVWHHKRATAPGLFKQLRRFAAGRVQLQRKRSEGLRPLHKFLGWTWVYALAALFVSAMFVPLPLLGLGLVAGWLGMAIFAVIQGEEFETAFLIPFAMVVVSLGWSTGYISETFFPMGSTAGR